jgi:hypothetical protein
MIANISDRLGGQLVDIVTLLIALPIGYFIRPRLTAVVTYIAMHSFVYTFQSTELIREWIGGDNSAYPKNPKTVAWSYALVTALIYAAGFALVLLGGWLAARRRQREADPMPELV